jgi:mono/diheme cytochrome c family protein
LALGLVLLAVAPLGGCDMTMFRQPKLKAQAPAPLFPDDSESQTPPQGAVAQGALAAEQASAAPPPITAALLARGQDRFQIFCKPCHGVSGAGDGTVVARGFPPPPDYASAQVRALTGAQIFGVITDGYGVMYPYGDRLVPRDRWAVVGYVRVLEAARTLGQAPVPPPPGSYGGER